MKLLKYGLPLLVVAIIAIALISPGKQKNSSIVQTNESESKATDITFGQTIDIEIQGQNHVSPGTTNYTAHNSNPPTSGDHYAQAPGWGVYKKEMSDLSAVHALEHGGIWISYQGSLDDESVKELKKIANSNAGAVIMSPRDENPAPIAIASWGKLMYLETPDTAIIKNFIDANKNNTHEPFAR